MNDKIKELAEQAGFNLPNNLVEGVNGPGVVTEKDKLAEFAELIVRECAKTAYLYASDSKNYKHYDDLGWDCLPGDLQSHIKEHFGVEE